MGELYEQVNCILVDATLNRLNCFESSVIMNFVVLDS